MIRISARKLLSATLLAAVAVVAGCNAPEPKSAGGSPEMRRLTDQQYHNIMVDVFGAGVDIGAKFDPLQRTEGLSTLSTATARVTPDGFERFYTTARIVSGNVVDEEHRATLVPCDIANPAVADDACATKFFKDTGRLLFRRALSEKELAFFVKAAHEGAEVHKDFYQGLGVALSAMLVTPEFLFVADATEADPANAGQQRLTGYAKAARLSFLLWNTAPDDVLLAAAEKGDLHTKAGVERQVTRLIESPNLDQGVRAFFADFLDFQKFETLEKDPVIYPTFTSTVADDAREQVLRTISDVVVTRDADYRDVFTTTKTYMNRTLARVYRVSADRTDDGWSAYEFPKDDMRAGIQTQVAMLALYAHPGRSSPTLRGRAVRELLLCQHIPDPPGDVDFSLFNDPNSPNKTARDRLTAHQNAPACAGCHKLTDPIGLTFENFDGAGQFRTTENEVEIDTKGDLNGKPYIDPRGFAKALHDDPATSQCLANRLYAYSVGHAPAQGDREFVKYLETSFASDGYKFKSLLKRIALSDAFFIIKPKSAPPATATAPNWVEMG